MDLRFKFILTAILLVFSLSGCETMKAVIEPNVLSNIGRAGVISLVGDKVNYKQVGRTIFGNENHTLDISDWEISEAYEAQMVASLTKFDLFEVSRINYDKEELYPVYNRTPVLNMLDWQSIEGELKKISEENSLDVIFMLLESGTSDYFTYSNQTIDGLGFFTSKVPIPYSNLPPPYMVHLISLLVAIDGNTGKPFAMMRLMKDDFAKPELFSRKIYDEAYKKNVKNILVNLPGNKWKYTFSEFLGK